MKEEIKRYILDEDILYPNYNRNIAREIYWNNVNEEWSSYIFGRFNAYNLMYPISFANFLRLYFFDEEIEHYTDAKDFLLKSPHVQINPGTKKYKRFFEEALSEINFSPVNFTEIIYCFRNNLKDRPLCKECNRTNTTFTVYLDGYRTFCSQKCQLYHINKLKEPKRSKKTYTEIRQIISKIPLDLRNLSSQRIAENFINIVDYSKHIKHLSESERIFIFMQECSHSDISCRHCRKPKRFKSQGVGYTKTCGRKMCIDMERFGDNYYKENDINYRVYKGGCSFSSGFLYVLRSDALNAYKIGITQNPIKRLNALKSAVADLKIVECIYLNNSLHKLEQHFHKAFKNNRVLFENSFDGYTEFFNLGIGDIEYIRNYLNESK